MKTSQAKSILESLIFVSGKPIEIKKLIKISGLNKKIVRETLEELIEEYKEQKRGISIVLKKNSVQMVTAPYFSDYVKKLVTSELQEDLSKAALETLTIIAYRGPMTRAEIEAIRGVNSIYILRTLAIRGLIDKKRSSKDARKSVYEVSLDFLKHLGLPSIKKLPNYEELRKELRFKEIEKTPPPARTN